MNEWRLILTPFNITSGKTKTNRTFGDELGCMFAFHIYLSTQLCSGLSESSRNICIVVVNLDKKKNKQTKQQANKLEIRFELNIDTCMIILKYIKITVKIRLSTQVVSEYA